MKCSCGGKMRTSMVPPHQHGEEQIMYVSTCSKCGHTQDAPNYMGWFVAICLLAAFPLFAILLSVASSSNR